MSARGTLSRAFLQGHPDVAASLLERYVTVDVCAVLTDLPAEVVAPVLARMAPVAAGACIEGLPAKLAGAALEAMALDVASTLLRRVSDDARPRLVAALSRKTSDTLEALLHYPERTAGALLDPAALALPFDLPTTLAVEQVRGHKGQLDSEVYVIGRDQTFQGVVTLRALLAAPGDARLESLVQPPAGRLAAVAGIAEVLANPGWADTRSLPVVDANGMFLGALRFDTIRRLDQEAERQVVISTGVLIGLSELCWMGFAQVLASVAAAATSTIGAMGETHGRER